MARLAELFCRCWGDGAAWEPAEEPGAPREAGCLRLDCEKLKTALDWRPRWHVDTAVELTCRLGRILLEGGRRPRRDGPGASPVSGDAAGAL